MSNSEHDDKLGKAIVNIRWFIFAAKVIVVVIRLSDLLLNWWYNYGIIVPYERRRMICHRLCQLKN